MEKKISKRIYELDALRGIAALMVILFHYTTKYAETFNSSLTTQFEFKYGHYGVSLFFIISGFVIFMTVYSIKTPFQFIFKRFVRLYPVFWVCLTLTFLYTTIVNIPILTRTFSEYLINFSMIPSLLGFRAIDGVYWSLVPELFFYALILILIIKKWLQKILLICFIWLGISFADIYMDLPIFVEIILNLKYGFLFVTGINFYQIYVKNYSWVNYLQLFICFIICYLQGDIVFTRFFIFFIFLFSAFVNGKLQFLKIKSIVFLGEISYVLYLLHQFIGYGIINKLINSGVRNYFVLVITPLLISILLAAFITFKVEKPMIKKINFLFKKNIK